MFFLILAFDRPGTLEARMAHRPAHLAYWQGLGGAVRLGGPMLTADAADATPKGSAFVVEADTIAVARALLAGDPFTVAGIFDENPRIEPFRPTLGDWKP